jgi:hypothetical protein
MMKCFIGTHNGLWKIGYAQENAINFLKTKTDGEDKMYRLIFKVRGESHELKDKNAQIIWDKIFELQEGKQRCPEYVEWFLYNPGGILIHSSAENRILYKT